MSNRINPLEIFASLLGITITLAILALGLWATVYIFNLITTHSNIDEEYILEVVNEHTVRLKNVDSGKLYVIPMDSIQSTIQEDNI